MAFSLQGSAVSRGVAIGRALVLDATHLEIEHYQLPADKVDAEVARLSQAFDRVRSELISLRDELPADAPPEMAAFLDLHGMILDDPMLTEASRELVRERRYNAEWAVAVQLEALVEQFDAFDDEYLRERKFDVQQVVDRVLKVLAGSETRLPEQQGTRDADLIIIARDIAPADMLHFKDRKFAGFATDLGGATSHTAILARSLGIPAVVGLNNAHAMVRPDEWVVVDGEAGMLIADADALILDEYRDRSETMALERARLKRLRTVPARMLDGTHVDLLANIDLPEDSAQAIEAGAAGVGLFRTEFLFMNRDELPDEEEQYDAYRRVVLAMAGKPVTIRTLDIGADKDIEALADQRAVATNPAMGLRAIRYCLSEPKMFGKQLRALLRASAHGPVKLLVPMLSSYDEMQATLAAIARAKQQLTERGQAFDPHLPIGAMIEIPAAALAVGMFLPYVDFVSIGTNDLIQYTLAIDRADPEVAGMYDPLHPAVLHLIYMTIQASAHVGKPVSVCGEMAGDPELTRLLLGMGLRQFSAHPSQLLQVKQQILHTDLAQAEVATRELLATLEPDKLRALLQQLNRGGK